MGILRFLIFLNQKSVIIPKFLRKVAILKSHRGFGKKYFTFASMQAHTVQISLDRMVTVSKSLVYRESNSTDTEEEESPPLDPFSPLLINLQDSKPCHCNCLFQNKTALAITLFRFIPRCPYYDTFFAFRRTGVHPPL